MYLTIDIGNSGIKGALYDKTGQLQLFWPQMDDLPDMEKEQVTAAIVCASGKEPSFMERWPSHVALHRLSSTSRLPLRLDYLTPETLGADRIAAACGAWAQYRGHEIVVVDAGTCITIDRIDADGVYRGGAILPGIAMRLKAMHAFTDKLPEVPFGDTVDAQPCGRSTRECMLAGALCGARYEVAGFVDYYRRQHADLRVVATGGTPLCDEYDPHLVMKGLYEILAINIPQL